jgi:hypothetical protein
MAAPGDSFLEFTALSHRQVRLLMYSCERPNTRAITSSARPRQPRELAADHQKFPANRVRGATASGSVACGSGNYSGLGQPRSRAKIAKRHSCPHWNRKPLGGVRFTHCRRRGRILHFRPGVGRTGVVSVSVTTPAAVCG